MSKHCIFFPWKEKVENNYLQAYEKLLENKKNSKLSAGERTEIPLVLHGRIRYTIRVLGWTFPSRENIFIFSKDIILLQPVQLILIGYKYSNPSAKHHHSVSNTYPIKFRFFNLAFQVLYSKALTMISILSSSLSHTCSLLEIAYIPAMWKTDCLLMNLEMLFLCHQFLLFKILPFTQGLPRFV